MEVETTKLTIDMFGRGSLSEIIVLLNFGSYGNNLLLISFYFANFVNNFLARIPNLHQLGNSIKSELH